VESALAPHVKLQRCSHCGARFSATLSPEPFGDCGRCGAPIRGTGRCAACAAATELPEREVVLAADGELRRAIAEGWRFVGSAGLSRYLDRVARDVARVIPHAPAEVAVHVTDEEQIASLALPSGTIVVSRGLVASLADEAELAFALGRGLSLAVVASDAVVGAGLRATASCGSDDPWLRAAEDLLRFGHGDEREHAADAGGLAVLAALGYDRGAARRWLARLEGRARGGDPLLAVTSVAQPSTRDRLARLRALEVARSEAPRAGRSNREVFRRAAGHTVLTYELCPVTLELAPQAGPRPRSRIGRWVVLAALLALAALVLLLRL
jgi:hypothetical protein